MDAHGAETPPPVRAAPTAWSAALDGNHATKREEEGVSGIPHHAPSVRLGARRVPAAASAALLAGTALLAMALAGCSSASSSQAAAPAALGSAVHQDCTAVGDVLSDGPDPGADSAGYAQAQVLPLRQLTISDAALHRDVLTLAAAYQAFSSAGSAGRAAAAAAVTKAENAVNSICPEAAS